jgi:uncharacterized membrane protein
VFLVPLRLLTRLLLAALFLTASFIHFRHPEPFLLIMPPWIPFHRACVLISGIVELFGGVGLLIPVRQIQFATGWILTLLLIAVFPANIYMAVDHIQLPNLEIPSWIEWARLPLQPLLIVAVLWVTGAWSGICTKEVHVTKATN